MADIRDGSFPAVRVDRANAEAERGQDGRALQASPAHAAAGSGSKRVGISDRPTSRPPWRLRPRRVHPPTPFRRRAVPPALRYMAPERDRFRGTACGASPANEPGCRLHVDHIVPVASGGLTLLDNLQTLCAECNRGKGGADGGGKGEHGAGARVPEPPEPAAGRAPGTARRRTRPKAPAG
jgi:5-methylcytosine-specific restriction endonuclease McrA